jgi:signal transduction histidine kinase
MNVIKRLADKYVFTEDLPRDARILNMTCLFGFLAALFAMVIRIIEQMNFVSITSMALILLTIVTLFLIANYFEAHRVAALFALITLGEFLFPIEFFATGGIDGSMSACFVLSIVIVFFLSRGKLFALLLAIHILTIVACYIISLNFPELVTPIPETNRMAEQLHSIIISGLLIGCVVFYQNIIYDNEQRKAQEASRAKSDFLSSMSHEMRTPMNAIIGMTTIGRGSAEIEKKDYALDMVKEASAHLLGVINDILDMSKIEADKFELSFVDFDFEEMLEKVKAITKLKMDEKKLFYVVRVDKNIPKTIISDNQRLSQVIVNLLSNSIKFTPNRGTIALDAKLIGKIDDVYEIQIEVTDTGIGLTEEQIGKLFDSFVQADSGTARKFGGTGLGLAISKSIVEMLDGKIWVESKPCRGSKFTFTFKTESGSDTLVAEAAAEILEQEFIDDDEEPTFPDKRVLLAEDIDINREIAIALLEPSLVEVDCAKNGTEALEMFESNPQKYSLIFMDVMMPEMDGYEATRKIRALDFPSAKQIPIIAMTANVFKEDIEKCLAAGMNDHIGKPIDYNILMTKLAESLD